MEKYSVLMSVYKNDEAGPFRLSLDSMINQSIAPDEIVLVIDGKLDCELMLVIEEYVLAHSELFHLIKNENNIGLGLSLQKGVLACKNELIARMDSDDIARNDRCKKQLECFEKIPNLAVVGGQIQEFQGDITNIIGKRVVPCDNMSIYRYMKRRCPFNHMSVMFKKSEVLRAGNYQHLLYNEDYQLWVNLAIKHAVFFNIDEILVDVRVNEQTYERRGGEQYYESEKVVQKMMLEAKIIDFLRYSWNMLIRFILQRVFPNAVRSKIFKVLRKLC